jgi:hypothetical protein
MPLATQIDPLNDLLSTAKRIESLLEILTKQALRDSFDAELADPVAASVYDLTGERTARDIAVHTGLGIASISRLWTRWERLGIVVKDGQRYRKTFEDVENRAGRQGARARTSPPASGSTDGIDHLNASYAENIARRVLPNE